MLEIIAHYIFEGLLGSIFYGIGWLFLRLITLGYYPPVAPSPSTKRWVLGLGAALPFVVITALFS